MKRLQPYSEEIEVQMRKFYRSLNERDRRRYAAIEAKKLGYGGISYMCRILGCDAGSIKHGLSDLTQELSKSDGMIRRKGGGRKRSIETIAGLDTAFLEVMTPHTAGSPVDASIKWSNLSRNAIAEALSEKGFPVSVTVVDQLLKKHNFRRRQAFKSVSGKQVAQRDEQFKNIAKLVSAAKEKGNPVMSMDVKKKN